MDIFKILDIEKTKDKMAIKQAYLSKLSETNPEDKPEEFMMLREAYEKALEYFEKGLPHATGNAWAEIMKNEVAVYEKQGDFEKAKEVMAQYIEVCPNDEAAMREYEFLKTR